MAARPAELTLLAISDRRSLGGETVERWARRIADAGVRAIQLREKDLEDRRIFELALRLRRILSAQTILLVNGRPDLALAAGADGVHLPAAGLPAAPLRRRWGDSMLIGRSTHTVGEVEEARLDGVDYVTFGPVYATPSKKAYGPPLGLAELRRAASVGVPVLALGGVTIENLSAVSAAGAAGAAGIRMFLEAEEVGRLVAAARPRFARSRARTWTS